MANLTEQLIDFALHFRDEDIPDAVLENQKTCIMDSTGVMCAASTLEPACQPFLSFADAESGSRTCTVLGTWEKASPMMAAMANGALIHALDYEDGHDESKAHPNTAAIPVLLALGEHFHKSGSEVLSAMVISSEIACRLKNALRKDDLRNGWYSPPMFSSYGAVLGAARLLGFDEDLACDALSICVTQNMMIGQSARSSRSVLRGVREAFSAKAAIFSALLAKEGVKARMDQPLEGPLGVFHVVIDDEYSPESVLEGLGERWLSNELRFKYWPCCGSTHAALSVLLEILQEHDVKPEEIEELFFEVNPGMRNVLEPELVKKRPESLAAAKFSLPFTAALGILCGNVELSSYAEEKLHDTRFLQIMDKVKFSVREQDPDLKPGMFKDDHVRLTVQTTRGSFTAETFASPGGRQRPLTDDQIYGKFKDCMTHCARPIEVDKLTARLRGFETISDLSELFS